jgi:hypothetical protein
MTLLPHFKSLMSPSFAKFKLVPMLLWLAVSIISGEILSQFEPLQSGVLGGPASWISAAFTMIIAVYFFVSYLKEFAAAETLLKDHQLPCKYCGYPLLHEPNPKCPECGATESWSHSAHYWKERMVVDPTKIQLHPPVATSQIEPL